MFAMQKTKMLERQAEISQDKLGRRFEKLLGGLFDGDLEDGLFEACDEIVPFSTLINRKDFSRSDLCHMIEDQQRARVKRMDMVFVGFRTTTHGGFAIAHNRRFPCYLDSDQTLHMANYVSLLTREPGDIKVHMVEDFKAQFGRGT